MASLDKSPKGWYLLRWYNKNKSPTKTTEPLKTRSKREATLLKSQLEIDYIRGLHDPWTRKWFERPESSSNDILIVAYDQYLNYKNELKVWSDNSRISVRNRLRTYIELLGPTRECSGITSTEIFKLVNGLNLSDATKHADLIKLRAFFKWMYDEKIIPEPVKIPHIKIQRNLPVFLTTEQIHKVCDHLIKKKQSRAKFQRSEEYNTLWHIDAIWLSARTGLRIEELMKLKVQDCASDQILVGGSYTTKGKKQRLIPLMDKALPVVQKYIDPEFRANDIFLSRNDYLFGRSGSAPKAKLSRSFIQAVTECLGIKRKFHDLRHSFAYWYLTAESDKNTQFRLVALKELLGHESIETTMIYAKISTEDLRL